MHEYSALTKDTSESFARKDAVELDAIRKASRPHTHSKWIVAPESGSHKIQL
jgi:hypothetical protein